MLHRSPRLVRYNASSRMRPTLDTSFTLHTIWTVTTCIEGALLAEGTLFRDLDEKKFITYPEHSRSNRSTVVGKWKALGRTYAHKSLFHPLKGLQEQFMSWSSSFYNRAMRAINFHETLLPYLERQKKVDYKTNEDVLRLKRKLKDSGIIDQFYIDSFRDQAQSLITGIDGDSVLSELNRLVEFLRSICEEGNDKVILGYEDVGRPFTSHSSSESASESPFNRLPGGSISAPGLSTQLIYDSPQWLLSLADRFPESRLRIDPHNIDTYERAYKLAFEALISLQELLHTIDAWEKLADDMKGPYDMWVRRINRIEKVIEKQKKMKEVEEWIEEIIKEEERWEKTKKWLIEWRRGDVGDIRRWMGTGRKRKATQAGMDL